MKVHIIGAGIAGLSAAIGLRRVGCEVIVSDRAAGVHEVGAGISIWSNAMRALDVLGAGPGVRGLSLPAKHAEFRLADGHRRVMGMNLEIDARDPAAECPLWMIHRADLVATLAKLLPPATFRWNQTLADIQSFEDQVTAQFADGSRVMSEVLVGADGIHSAVRRYVLGQCRPRYAGYTCHRGICKASPSLVPTGWICESWGRGQRFGITSLRDQNVYWWATRQAPYGALDKNPSDQLRKRFQQWGAPIPQILKSTPAESILQNDILDHEPQLPWHRGRVALVGDAAHAVTPNFGQGGCLAIEDAVALARTMRPLVEELRRRGAMASPAAIEKAWAQFTAERFPRCRWLARKSLQFGKIGQLSSKWSVALRDFVIGVTPSRLFRRSLERPMEFDPGKL